MDSPSFSKLCWISAHLAKKRRTFCQPDICGTQSFQSNNLQLAQIQKLVPVFFSFFFLDPSASGHTTFKMLYGAV